MKLATTMDEAQIRHRLDHLEPDTPWAHHFDFGNGLETVTSSNEKFYGKAKSLKKLGKLIVELAPFHLRSGKLKGSRILDVASAEGEHSIRFASHGASVVGVEGRQLYVDRAQFAADCLGVSDSCRFIKGDVRSLVKTELGEFDLVVASGILHHLNIEAFEGFLKDLADLTTDACIIYTHVSSDASIRQHRLEGPVNTANGYTGYLYREHKESSSPEERLKGVRASLDNTQSFWAEEKALVNALVASGFDSVVKSLSPHVFGNIDRAAYRPVLICRKHRQRKVIGNEQ